MKVFGNEVERDASGNIGLWIKFMHMMKMEIEFEKFLNAASQKILMKKENILGFNIDCLYFYHIFECPRIISHQYSRNSHLTGYEVEWLSAGDTGKSSWFSKIF